MASNTPRIDALESNRNLILNGNFDFWQRGSSATYTTPVDAFLADRWRISTWNTCSITLTQDATSVPTADQSGFASVNSWKITNNSSSAGAVQVVYPMEGNDFATIHRQKVRLQFWVRCSIAGLYSVAFTSGNNDRSYVAEYTINASNTWEKKTFDIQMDQGGLVSSYPLDRNQGMRITFTVASGTGGGLGSTIGTWHNGDIRGSTNVASTWRTTTNATFQLSQVSLMRISTDTNSVTNFVRAGLTISDELAKCQRYCWAPSSGPLGNGIVAPSQNTINGIFVKFPTTMRSSTPVIFMPTAIGSTLGMVRLEDNVQNNTATSVAFSTGITDHKSENGAYINVVGSAAFLTAMVPAGVTVRPGGVFGFETEI